MSRLQVSRCESSEDYYLFVANSAQGKWKLSKADLLSWLCLAGTSKSTKIPQATANLGAAPSGKDMAWHHDVVLSKIRNMKAL